jgi:hypothetical protein
MDFLMVVLSVTAAPVVAVNVFRKVTRMKGLQVALPSLGGSEFRRGFQRGMLRTPWGW